MISHKLTKEQLDQLPAVLVARYNVYMAQVRLIEKENEKLKLLSSEVSEACAHELKEEKRYYFPGSYYDMAYTDHWDECLVCGQRSEKIREHHSWYG